MSQFGEYLKPFMSSTFGNDRPRDFKTVAGSPVESLYCDSNGGYFWGRALLIRPIDFCYSAPLTVSAWNSPELWKSNYGAICSECRFFAEDTFGIQVGILDDNVVQFDPETATISTVGHSLEEWLGHLLADPDFHTGAPVLRAWEQKHGLIPPGNRLVPKQLFMLGGEFHSSNMVSKRDVDGMRLRAQFWKLTKDLPDGQTIAFHVVE
ncbi:MAG TPA: hypothetical protein PK156_24245 [Polyangium sp.]|nr:hypothetical protein [Polyangium sp.]